MNPKGVIREKVKVVFKLDPEEWHGHSTESVWGAVKKSNGNIIDIENSPFFVRGVSYRDSVRVTAKNGSYLFSKMVKKSGYATVRVLIENYREKKRLVTKALGELERLECRYEGGAIGDSQLFSIAVPPSAAAKEVMRIVEGGCVRDLWDAEIADSAGRTEFSE